MKSINYNSSKGTRWLVWDFVIGFLSFNLAYTISPYNPIPQYYYYLAVGGLFGTILCIISRLCDVPIRPHGRTTYELLTTSIIAVALSYLIFGLLVNLIIVRAYGRYVVIFTCLFAFLGIFLPRFRHRTLLLKTPIKISIYGKDIKALEYYANTLDRTFKIISLITPNNAGEDGSTIEVNFSRKIIKDNSDLSPDILIIYDKDTIDNKLISQLFDITAAGIEVFTKEAFIEKYYRKMPLENINNHWIVSNISFAGYNSFCFLKRLFDYTIAGLALLATLPLWLIIMIIIPIDSKGGCFYTQKRVGYKGKVFNIIKFRTMIANAEQEGAQWAQKEDKRVTRIGRFLRRTRLDELPQLINIIKGEMSIVGPRPERPEFVDDLKNRIPFYEFRHMVLPGLTGWAQIKYQYGASYQDALEKLQYDLYYIKHSSPLFDIQIILNTIPLLMKGSR